MPPTIADPEIERLARELAEKTGQPVEDALACALRSALREASGETAGAPDVETATASGPKPQGRGIEYSPLTRGSSIRVRRFEATTDALWGRFRIIGPTYRGVPVDPDTAPRLGTIEDIQRFVASRTIQDGRTPEEVIGYDEAGLFD